MQKQHHGLPEEHRIWFESHGVNNIDNGAYYFDLPKDVHRLKSGNGIHTKNNSLGKTWNATWNEYINSHPNANKKDIGHL